MQAAVGPAESGVVTSPAEPSVDADEPGVDVEAVEVWWPKV